MIVSQLSHERFIPKGHEIGVFVGFKYHAKNFPPVREDGRKAREISRGVMEKTGSWKTMVRGEFNKRVHNGKDRHTGRKIPNRSEHDKKVKTRSIGTGRGFVPIKDTRRPTRSRCNCTGEVLDKVNERLFNAWRKISRPTSGMH